ncbi:MAG: biopolymer transporter ExbD [Bacteroidetes bacterium]|jgi:biopolymer transport protein ExbD|nr:biopolymer transporter ExbD [Bacteroidota bacterium]MBT6685038.1 biopolymer transporter ExbD [Bacteroidota bacterium]MBT7143116.1 biopolymer transporter ExbD [Bacteroidota bacterium]MBT7491471.1 biopolymer transporter ExbD [Bacteroidota bacterium]
MALRSRNKVSASFSMSSMTDIVFLLLIFFMVTSTLIHPNALKLLLPKSNNQTAAKPNLAVSIDKDYNIFLYNPSSGNQEQYNINSLESVLQERLGLGSDIYISLHVEKTVPIEEVVKVMNIAKRNKYKMVLATSP